MSFDWMVRLHQPEPCRSTRRSAVQSTIRTWRSRLTGSAWNSYP